MSIILIISTALPIQATNHNYNNSEYATISSNKTMQIKSEYILSDESQKKAYLSDIFSELNVPENIVDMMNPQLIQEFVSASEYGIKTQPTVKKIFSKQWFWFS